MRIRLVNPRNPVNTLVMPEIVRKLTISKPGLWPPLGLMVAAALADKSDNVEIVDECVGDVDHDAGDVDLVGITTMTCTATRAYEIGDLYRRRGVPVVMGGVHASAVPAEALGHADAVVVGEAEGNFERALADAREGRLRKIYKAQGRRAPIVTPRRDLIRSEDYLAYMAVQLSRGCPHRCTFCTTHAIFGNHYECRPIGDIVEEIRSLDASIYFFADDNVIGNLRWAKQLCRALIPLGIKWAGQCSMVIARDDELLGLMRASGCQGVILGLESPRQTNLDAGRKDFVKASDYLKLIRRIQSHDISIWGSFLLGFDDDTVEDIRAMVRFARRAKLVMSCYPILTPYPGTELYERFKAEGRLITEDWSRYNGASVVFRPKRMTVEELQEAQMAAFAEFFSPASIFGRLGLYPLKKYSWMANTAIWRAIGYYYRHKKHRPVPSFEAIRRASRQATTRHAQPEAAATFPAEVRTRANP